jgi:K+-transporting ATPase KdpF subunit
MSGPLSSFSQSASATRLGAKNSKEIFMGTLIVGLISLALLVYLFIAMIWPEKF